MAIDFVENQYEYTDSPHQFIDKLKSELYRYNNESDKLHFISIIRNFIQNDHDKHYKDCKNRENCNELKDYNKSLFFIDGIRTDYGIKLNKDDIFSENEKKNYNNKLDQILHDLQEMKQGQEIIYNDLLEEIEELKKLYFLGKKNWKQLLAGKTVEMVAGGIVSETVSTQLIRLTGIVTGNLLK
ncbi:hypothetical protein [Olleya marilimosa]|uniref:hypothetical protein n=1 Tax=Olleya marilimosa TaxID=272164 RepID=UPI0012FBA8E3|nr:hypothetical protein [Olleya marilimosa]